MPDSAHLKEAIHTLTKILQRQCDHGRNGIVLTDEQLSILNHLPQRLRQNSLASTGPAQASSLAARSVPPTGTVNQTPPIHDDEYLARGIEDLHPQGQDRREKLNHLARMVKADESCLALGTLRKTMVFATGNPEAQLMLIGEAPGAEEERQRKPFVGPAGQLLDKILGAMGFTRDDVYISNIVKFRPQVEGARNTDTGNRKPSRDEIDTCLKYIMAEIDIIQPKVIIAL